MALLLSSCNAQTHDTASSTRSDEHHIGSYTDFRVVDGDTFRIEGLDRGVRFLFIDTEEVPRGETAAKQLEQLRSTWPHAYHERRGDNPFPIKMPSPFGWETAEAARQWFSDVDSIRLERDSNDNIYGFFGRWLAYVFAKKNGSWLNYNVECVRMGWSPYYGKYGFSERFHDAFLIAEREARAAGRGIWDPTEQHYPDYDERLRWWNTRGEAIHGFLEAQSVDDGLYFIGRDGEYERLALATGTEVVVFGMVDWITDTRPARTLKLPHKKDIDVLVEIPGDVSEEWLAEREQQYVYVRGTVHGSGRRLQIRPATVENISLSPLPSSGAPR
ncbi:MAG: thermonuclease family protein [Bacteroidetes bacterium]|nr:thermonuclease family protein [Bacteroidota bacterium]